jgi:hypothetical protein
MKALINGKEIKAKIGVRTNLTDINGPKSRNITFVFKVVFNTNDVIESHPELENIIEPIDISIDIVDFYGMDVGLTTIFTSIDSLKPGKEASIAIKSGAALSWGNLIKENEIGLLHLSAFLLGSLGENEMGDPYALSFINKEIIHESIH